MLLRIKAELLSLLKTGTAHMADTYRNSYKHLSPLNFTWEKQVKDTQKGKR